MRFHFYIPDFGGHPSVYGKNTKHTYRKFCSSEAELWAFSQVFVRQSRVRVRVRICACVRICVLVCCRMMQGKMRHNLHHPFVGLDK